MSGTRELQRFKYHPNLYELDIFERFEGTPGGHELHLGLAPIRCVAHGNPEPGCAEHGNIVVRVADGDTGFQGNIQQAAQALQSGALADAGSGAFQGGYFGVDQLQIRCFQLSPGTDPFSYFRMIKIDFQHGFPAGSRDVRPDLVPPADRQFRSPAFVKEAAVQAGFPQVLPPVQFLRQKLLKDDETISGVPDIVYAAENLGFTLCKDNIEEQPRETDEQLDAYYRLVAERISKMASQGINAFYLTVDLINDLTLLKGLLKPFYDRNIPVYLMDDVEAVRNGGLMLISANDAENVGRFIAEVIAKTLNGAEAGSLPCVYSSAPGIYLNYDVAKEIYYPLDFEFLTICDQIFTKGA